MRKGQVTLLLVGLLMAATFGIIGFFAENQVEEMELQRMGIDSVATSICVRYPPIIPNFKFSNGE